MPRDATENWADVSRLRLAHGALVLAVYAVYGYQVCPFLETLTFVELMAPAAIGVAAHVLIASAAERIVGRGPVGAALGRIFSIEVGAAIAVGSAVALFNALTYGFPFDSGVKVVFAFAALGVFAALDGAFEREIRLSRILRARGEAFPIGARFLPFQTKFVAFSMINIVVSALAIMLVVMKDIAWIMETGAVDAHAKRVVLAELGFVVLILGGYAFRVVRQYGRKTERALSDERAALKRVAAGDLDTRVTVASGDEFGEIAALTNDMIGRLSDTVSELEATRDATIGALVSIAAARDNETGLHIVRTKLYAAALAEELSTGPKHAGVVDATFIARIESSAPLHDIGKVGVPDAILAKPGRLTADEFEIMKTHAEIGAAALEQADRRLGGSSFLAMARDIALSHHERWDGAGYPQGLEGEAIPLAARIMAVADVYDAVRSKRVYKPARTHAEAAQIIKDGRGTQFDPDVVDAFDRIEPLILEIAERHSEPDDAAEEGAAAA